METSELDLAERIERGVRNGMRRLREAQMDPGLPPRIRVRHVVSTYIDNQEESYTTWFWEFAAEALTIAIGARIANREREVPMEDLWGYIDTLAEYSNSWKHSWR